MKKLFKVLTVVMLILPMSSFGKMKNPTFKKIKKELWHRGVFAKTINPASPMELEEDLHQNPQVHYPEELIRAIIKLESEKKL